MAYLEGFFSFNALKAFIRRLLWGDNQRSFQTERPGGVAATKDPSVRLSQLMARKRELRERLEHFDRDFARRNGRMPTRDEKQHIRHLYEAYNSLKIEIHLTEQETSKLQDHTKQRLKNEQEGPSLSPQSPSTANGDLVSLKREKRDLHQMLRAYEKRFFKENQRQVSSFDDIKPVYEQYQRFKKVKKAIDFAYLIKRLVADARAQGDISFANSIPETEQTHSIITGDPDCMPQPSSNASSGRAVADQELSVANADKTESDDWSIVSMSSSMQPPTPDDEKANNV